MEKQKKSVNANTLTVTNIIINIIWYLGFLYLGYLLAFTIYLYFNLENATFNDMSGWYSMTVYDIIKIFAVLWIMFYLRRIIKNVRKGIPFREFIHDKLKNIGVLLIAISLIHTAFHCLIAGFSELDFHFEIVFIGIVFVIFSQIMKAGYKLQQEQDLTI